MQNFRVPFSTTGIVAMAEAQSRDSQPSSLFNKDAVTSHETAVSGPNDDEKLTPPNPDAEPSPGPGVRNMGKISWILVLISILSAVFLFALDNTVVADIQPKIINLFGEIEKLPWASVAFALGAVAVNLFWYAVSKSSSAVPPLTLM